MQQFQQDDSAGNVAVRAARFPPASREVRLSFFSKPGAAVSLDGLRLRGRADRLELLIQPAASVRLVRRWVNETSGNRRAKVRW